MHPIVITASTMMELSHLIAAASAVPTREVPHLSAFRGEIGGSEVVLALTGIGKVNAAMAATLLLERFRPELLINIGCGGAYPGGALSVGDLAVAESESFADEGVQTPDGWRGLELIGIPVIEVRGERLYNALPLPAEVAASATRSATEQGFRVESGPFLTVSTCSGTAAHGAEVTRRFAGICENMEGAAVAQVALVYDAPLLEVRGISNMVEERDLSRWDLKTAVLQPQKFLLGYLGSRRQRP